MKVYIVRELDYENQIIKGVYRSLEDARKRAESVYADAKETAANAWAPRGSSYIRTPNPVEVVECIVDYDGGARQVLLLDSDEDIDELEDDTLSQ